MKGLLPVFLLALLTFWGGNLFGGATAAGAASAHAAVLAFALLGTAAWKDPLGLGRVVRWWVPAGLLIVALGWWLGPVPRAGVVAVLLLPAIVLLPAAVAACWRRPRDRRRGLAALAALVAAVAAVALFEWRLQATPRTAMPLGHHNLLAAWLILLWPIALLTLWRGALTRALAVLAGGLAFAALAASASLVAACALAVQVLVLGLLQKRLRLGLGLLAVVAAVWLAPTLMRAGGDRSSEASTAAPEASSAGDLENARGGVGGGLVGRARDVVAGSDRSGRARAVYARAGWRGLRERPFLGWGPGAVPWTAARFLEPVPGLNPPSEVVGDLHSWPIQLGYETGAAGLLVGSLVALLFAWRRFADLRRAGAGNGGDPALLRASGIALAGGAILLAGNAPAHILALPAALAVAAGAALASRPPVPTPEPRRGVAPALRIGVLYALAAALLLSPFERAHFHYQAARRAALDGDSRKALEQIRKASRLDPEFPLYPARAAWLLAETEGSSREAAEQARRAAELARSVAPLWLSAGVMGSEARSPWAVAALERARELDPLSPLPAFHLLEARPERSDALELGRFAVAAEPSLAAAVFWEERPELARRVLRDPPDAPAAESATVLLALRMDHEPAVSFSLYGFRRSAWPADLAPVELRRERLAAVSARPPVE